MKKEFNFHEELRKIFEKRDAINCWYHKQINKKFNEFIKRLKEKLCNEFLKGGKSEASCDRIPQSKILFAIDKLAGDLK